MRNQAGSIGCGANLHNPTSFLLQEEVSAGNLIPLKGFNLYGEQRHYWMLCENCLREYQQGQQ
jgi:hypothetical protein